MKKRNRLMGNNKLIGCMVRKFVNIASINITKTKDVIEEYKITFIWRYN